MSRILNLVESPGPIIPKELKRFNIRATYPLNQVEAGIFTMALEGIVEQMYVENYNFNNLPPVCVVITKSGSFAYEEFDEEDIMGFRIVFIIFCVDKWRKRQYSDLNVLTCYLEELCHHYWNIIDEEEVKLKVLEIAKHIINSDIKFTDLFSANWKDTYPHIYGNNNSQ